MFVCGYRLKDAFFGPFTVGRIRHLIGQEALEVRPDPVEHYGRETLNKTLSDKQIHIRCFFLTSASL